MTHNPLSRPADIRILSTFMAHYNLRPTGPPRMLLKSLTKAFASLPYENLTKIINEDEFSTAEKSRRGPHEVINSHIAWGTGGTCFSLTAALLYLVRCMGWEAEAILADRRYGQNTHCALLVWIDGMPHLLDPGFLIVDPIPLSIHDDRKIETGFNRIFLSPNFGGERVSLFTVQQGVKTYRLSFKTQPADTGEFLNAWDASFSWDMMRYPLLTRTSCSRQLYLRGTRFQIRENNLVTYQNISMDDLVCEITSKFHIHPAVSTRAISILKRKGKTYGETSSR